MSKPNQSSAPESTGPGLTDRLGGQPRSEVAEFFASSDAVEITDLIRQASDAELEALIEDEGFRQEGITAILARFPEFADPERLRALRGVVCFDLSRPDGAPEQHTACFEDGTVVLDEAATCDVTLRAPVLAFVRLVTGQCNAALLYLSGRLTISGDAMLALDVGSVFRLPGSDAPAVDPTTLDPVEVATAIGEVSRDHLREVMGGHFREIVVGEVFRRFPEFMDEHKARHQHLDIGFRIAGRPDGGADRYVVHIDEGSCTVEADPPEGTHRDATLLLDGPDFLKLVTGHINPVKALLGGKLKLKGDRGKALAFNAVMNPPRART